MSGPDVSVAASEDGVDALEHAASISARPTTTTSTAWARGGLIGGPPAEVLS